MRALRTFLLLFAVGLSVGVGVQAVSAGDGDPNELILPPLPAPLSWEDPVTHRIDTDSLPESIDVLDCEGNVVGTLHGNPLHPNSSSTWTPKSSDGTPCVEFGVRSIEQVGPGR